jgi:hypothetical protein
MERAGFNVSGYGGGRMGTAMRETWGGPRSSPMGADEFESAAAAMMAAQSGHVSGRASDLLAEMTGNESGTRRSIMRAMSAARGTGDESQFLSFLGGGGGTDRNLAAMAFMSRNGMVNPITMSRTDLELGGRGGGSFGDRLSSMWDSLTGEDVDATVSAAEYFAAGGGAAGDLRAEAERLRAGRSATS